MVDFKNEKRSELIVLDIMMQKADAFGDLYQIQFNPNQKYPIILSFNNGFRYANLPGNCLLFVAESQKDINEVRTFAKEYGANRNKNIVSIIVVLNRNTNLIKQEKNEIILYVSLIKRELDKYKPLHYNRLLSILDENAKKRVPKAVSPITNSSVSVDYSSSLDESESLSNAHLNEYRSFLINDSSECAFILGNGVSIPLGADPWDKLINNLIDYLSPFYIKNANGVIEELSKSNYLISSFVKATFEDKGQEDVYREGLKYCVYRKYNKGMLKENTLLKAIALAKIKYSNLAILTYNYDTFLEEQIKVCDSSYIIEPYSGDDYKTGIQNKIIHLHGKIEKNSRTIDKYLVLTDKEYFDAYLNNKENWAYKAQHDFLSKRTCLFIGSSMSDLFQLSIIDKVRSASNNNFSCYALMCSRDLEPNEKNNLIRFYLNKGIKVIFVEKFDKLAKTLNDITNCQFESSADLKTKE